MPKIRFLTHIFFSEQFRPYVASKVLYKCGHCGNFKLKIESLRPSGPKLRKISNTPNQKTGCGQKWVWPRQKKLKTGPVWFLRDQIDVFFHVDSESPHKISAPWINSWVHMTDRNLDSDPSPRLMKSHNQYCHLNLLPTDRQTKVIHVMRDPKDVLCSMYRHTQQSRTESVYEGTFQELYHYFLTGKKKGNYWDYNLQYLRNVNQHNILYLKYEDLIRDKLGGITQINSFLEYPTLTEQQVVEIDYNTTTIRRLR